MREPHGLRGLFSYVLLTSWQLVATAILFGLDAVSLAQGHGTSWLALLAAGAALLALRYMWFAQVDNLDRIGLETLSGLVQFRLTPAALAWWGTHVVASVVALACLDPGGFIERHRDPGNIFITCHLGLKIPDDCGIHVAGETRTWSEGRCLFFDSSREHYAFNRSEKARMILLFDFLNPSLTAAEQAFFRRYYGALAA